MRPQGVSILQDNITVSAPWVEIADVARASAQHGRVINNVSLAFPHPGVVHASTDPINNIIQPKQLDDLGAYDIKASVPSPVIHVLCAEISQEELKPMVYSEWPGAQNPLNTSDWPNQVPKWTKTNFLNATAVDDLFELGPKHGNRRPPAWGKYPADYNTLLNATGNYDLMDTIYLLSKGGPGVGYNMCSLRASQTPFCSTIYNVTSGGSHIAAHCEDPTDPFQYFRTNASEPAGNATLSRLWPQVGWGWGTAISLGDGLLDAKASSSRLLSQLTLTSRQGLDKTKPSMAEALAVLAGNTLLLSGADAPFVEIFNYTTLPPEGVYQHFPAGLRSQQYASGAMSASQNGFYIVLVLIFAANVVVLGWFLSHRGLVTDFSDPANMFSLLINSPPSLVFAGSCGGGPEKEQYAARFFVNVDGEHVFLEPPEMRETGQQGIEDVDMESVSSPITRTYAKLSKRKSFL